MRVGWLMKWLVGGHRGAPTARTGCPTRTGATSVTGLIMFVSLVMVAMPAVVACSPEESSDVGSTPTSTSAATTSGTEHTTAGSPTEPTTDELTNDRTRTPIAPATPPTPVVADTIATGLTTPWGLAFLPDGSALLSERDTGTIKRVAPGENPRPVGTVPGVVPNSEGGLLGIAVAPTFAEEPYVYAYLSTRSDNRVVRMRYEGDSLGAPEVLLADIPASFIHDGGRLAFGPDGMLYVSTGDASNQSNAQNPDTPAGKILRLTPDGEPAPGSPIEGSPVWSLGHRNVQGLAWDDRGRMWASEFGADAWDELNLIEPGGNYGWPEVEGRGGGNEFRDPVAQWPTPDASPSGLAYAAGSLWMASLNGERLWRITPRPDGTIEDRQDFFVEEYGRLRTVAAAPDGSLWLTTSNTDGRGNPREGDDRILRLELR